MKKYFAVFCSVLLVLRLAACSPAGDEHDYDADLSGEGESLSQQESEIYSEDVEWEYLGSDGTGYVKVPADWGMENIGDTGAVSIYSPDYNSYITLTFYSEDDLPEADMPRDEDGKREYCETYIASSLFESFEEQDVQNLEAARDIELCGYNTKQVYGVYESDYTEETCFIVAWVFFDGEVYRVVMAEGPRSAIMDNVGYVENSFTPFEPAGDVI